MGSHVIRSLAVKLALLLPVACVAAPQACVQRSGAMVAQVVELYTSEGCSSCPPADRWLSGLRSRAGQATVVQAFHVGYWDYIGWVDRFATPAHTQRQRQIARWNNHNGIYTPQAVLNGRDWPTWSQAGDTLPPTGEPARASIVLTQSGQDQFEALVRMEAGAPAQWSAYWTVTENGHSSRVKAGENAGETLSHDHVVRQYTPAGDYRPTDRVQRLLLRTIAATPGHARQINLVVYDSRTGRTLQAVSATC